MPTNPFTEFGGKVKFTPERVKTPLDVAPTLTEEDSIRNLALERDLIMADLLEGDQLLDMVDEAIDEQMKDFEIPADELADDARRLCGKETIDWECYKKAKDLLRVLPWVASGLDPVQAAFGQRLTRRDGPVIFDCRKFNMDDYANALAGTGGSQDTANPADPTNEDEEELVTIEELQAAALENQEKWAILILFWDFLWGKPHMREPWLTQSRLSDLDTDAIKANIAALREAGQDEEAEGLEIALAEHVLTMDRSSIIFEERPWEDKHLKWEVYPPTEEPVDLLGVGASFTRGSDGRQIYHNYDKRAAAIWIVPSSMFRLQDEYISLGIPALKSGFILSILMSITSMIPKITSGILKIRQKINETLSIFRKIPIVGERIYLAMKQFVSGLFIGFALINDAMISACVFLAMYPAGEFTPDFGEIPIDDIETPRAVADYSSINRGMSPSPTNSGFIALNCFDSANRIKNKVDLQAI